MLTPGDITFLALELLERRHPEHLAALEVERGLAAQTIEPIRTFAVLAGRLREDAPPAVLVGNVGLADEPDPANKHGKLDLTWSMGVQVVVIGTDRADVVLRLGWYVATVIECLLERMPRKGTPVDAIKLTDIDLTAGDAESERRPRTIGEALLSFDVFTRDAIGGRALPPDDSPVPPGTPGGPPATPYVPPVPWPAADSVTTSTDKDPLP